MGGAPTPPTQSGNSKVWICPSNRDDWQASGNTYFYNIPSPTKLTVLAWYAIYNALTDR